MWSLAFYYGSVVVNDGDCTFQDMLKGIMDVLIAAIMGGVVASQGPDLPQARDAASRVFAVLRDYHVWLLPTLFSL